MKPALGLAIEHLFHSAGSSRSCSVFAKYYSPGRRPLTHQLLTRPSPPRSLTSRSLLSAPTGHTTQSCLEVTL
ncbi:hypothetical protein PVAP13_7KG050918 [Panicum virgatum]|uniref:Uncharacterized protein n=1 Tax=Panicum virgatum TaxID=38727 RepID=A0A8T0Q5J6_PANVG|nr:hypothetical protein PVAP13_7KG050918 [Panicum virgatum]